MDKSTKYIVWDWNGTLLDDTHLVVDSTNAVFALLQKPAMTREEFTAKHVIPLEAFYRHIGFSEDEINRLRQENIFHDYYEARETTSHLREGALDILESVQASGVHSLILSNHIEEPIRRLLRQHAIEHYFTDVLAYACRKTQFKDMTKGQRLHHYFTNQSPKPTLGLIIGDTVEETEIGRSLGFMTIAITGGTISESRLRAASPDYVIHTLAELKPILHERGFLS